MFLRSHPPNENKSCMRVDWILAVKFAKTFITSHQNLNRLKVDMSVWEFDKARQVWALVNLSSWWGLLLISSHFSTRGSQVRCKLANYVSKFKNWAWTSQQSSQVHFSVWTAIVNKCSQFKLKLTIQWKVLGPVGYQEGLYFIELVIIIEYEHLFTNEVQR
jgi:hypothetical protein